MHLFSTDRPGANHCRKGGEKGFFAPAFLPPPSGKGKGGDCIQGGILVHSNIDRRATCEFFKKDLIPLSSGRFRHIAPFSFALNAHHAGGGISPLSLNTKF